MILYVTIIIFIITIIEMLGLWNLKKYSLTDNIIFYLFAIITFSVFAYMLSKLMKIERIGIINHVWNIMSSIMAFLIGYVFYKEKLNYYEFLGVVLSLFGMLLIYNSSSDY